MFFDFNRKLLKLFLFFLIFSILLPVFPSNISPNVTVVFVIDQFAYHYLWKVRPFFKHGLKKLFDRGIVYHDATFPHAMPSTPTGHAALSTGAFGYIHGVSNYGWIDETNEYVKITDDPAATSAVFSRKGMHDFGRSAKNLMVDTICDQFALTSEPSNKAYAYALSLKSRSAIMLAGRKGKAIWFDDLEGGLTSSLAYFDKLPDWLKRVNKDYAPKHKSKYRWNAFYKRGSKPYFFNEAKNYDFCASGKNTIGTRLTIDLSKEDPFKEFCATPFGNQLLFSAAKKCISQHLNVNEHRNSRMLVFISLSSFDLSGHLYGPDSLEQIDMLYHLDRQIGRFISSIQSIAGRKKSLFIVTGDHGVMPIPEILNVKGFSLPSRIDAKKLIDEMNEIGLKEFEVKNVIKHFEAPQFFVDKKIFGTLSEPRGQALLERLKLHILSKEGIRDCWTLRDLERTDSSTKNKYQVLFAKQIFKGRSGELTCMPHPYRMISSYPSGTSHCSPYRYDTHVPLAFYKTGTYDTGLQVQQPISMTQFPCTLARLINCPSPSCARGPILPGLYKF